MAYFWLFCLVVNAMAVVMSIETNDFDWLSYVSLFCMAWAALCLGSSVNER